MEALCLPLSKILTLVITPFPFKTHLRTGGGCRILKSACLLRAVGAPLLGGAATAPWLLLLLLLLPGRPCCRTAALILVVPPPTLIALKPVGILLSGGIPTGGAGIGGLELQSGGHEALQRFVLKRPHEAPNFGRAEGIYVDLLYPFFAHEGGGSCSLQRKGLVEAGNAPAFTGKALKD